ncbi:MAG: hypothetical protein ACPGVG_13275 [Mycobacterium sp.]
MHILKQSTAVDVLIGPFVDATNGYDGETGLSPSVKLSKNGQTLAAKNDATTPTHDADGYYNCELDATDTNTVGTLRLTVAGSATALPVFHDFQIVEEATYDALFGASAAGFDGSGNVTLKSGTHTGAVIPTVSALTGHTPQTGDSYARIGANGAGLADLVTATGFSTHSAADVWAVATRVLTASTNFNDLSAADVNAQVDTALADIHLDHLFANNYDPSSKPGTSTALLNELIENDGGVSRFTANALEQAPSGTGASAATIRAEIDANSTQLAAIVADTNELQTDWANGGRLDVILDGASAPTAAAVRAEIDSNSTRLAAIEADTNELQGDWTNGGRLDLLLDGVNTTVPPTVGEIADQVWDEASAGHTSPTSMAYWFTAIAARMGSFTGTSGDDIRGLLHAVMSKTATNPANVPGSFDPAADSLEAMRDAVNTTTPPTAAAIADAVLDEPTSGHTTAGTVGKLLGDVLEDTGTTLPASIAALNNVSVADVLAGTVEGSIDVQDVLKVILAACAGRSTDHENGTPRYRDQANSVNRIDATTDANGNRTGVTLNLG